MRIVFIILFFISVVMFYILTSDASKTDDLLYFTLITLPSLFFTIFFLFKSVKIKNDYRSTIVDRLIIVLFIALILFLLGIVFVNPI